MGLMEYLPAQAPRQGADKYYGNVASGYDVKREQDPKWIIEQKHIEDMLNGLMPGSWVLDIPCGTGRFFSFYAKKGFIIRGVDKSADMLQQAATKVIDPQKARLEVGDIRALTLDDKSVDASVACRITRWLSPEECVKALKELQRVTRQRIIFTARVRNHPHARSYDLINSALDGWKIHRDETGADLDYRIIELRPI